MKILIVGLIIFISGCSGQHRLVESHFNYKANFQKYKSFGFMISETNSTGIDNNDSRIIESIIYKRFKAMGYVYDINQPDLLISYKYFKKGTSLVTMDQASLKHWMGGSKRYEDVYVRKRKVNKDQGTLSIYFIDRNTSRMIFQGYYKGYDSEFSDHRVISSIGQLMDKYQITKY